MRRACPCTVISLSLALVEVACGGSAASSAGTNPPPAGIAVSVSPTSANVRSGASQQFQATVSGSSNQTVNWQVNGVAGGSPAMGTISSSGLYTAPGSLPNPNTVTIKAVSAVDSTRAATSDVTLWNPTPVISSIGPASLGTGSFTLTVAGSQFVNGAQVLFGGTALTTTFESSSELTARGTAQSAGTFGVLVSNPDPGGSNSATIDVEVSSGGDQAGTCSGIGLGQGASLNGFVPFPADNAWNQDISSAPVDPNSSTIINFIGPSVPLHPDFGSGLYQGQSMGIPYVVVGAQQGFVGIDFTESGDESDPGPMPIPSDAPIEGYPSPGSGDRHVLVLDKSNCWLYELYSAYPQNDGTWSAGSAAVWDIEADESRPWTWTSADAAGLSIFAGLARYDEAASGQINHALRFTLQYSRAAFVLPATHWAATSTSSTARPMGLRLRLKSSFDISQFSATNQAILKALEQYGMIMADNGSSMYISGAPDDRWNNDDLHQLSSVTASDFEVVKMGTVYTSSNLPQGSAPTIGSFTANPQVATTGTQVALNWVSSGASYFVVSPQMGAVRGNSATVAPTETTTYTLAATNQYGRSTATVTVTVQ